MVNVATTAHAAVSCVPVSGTCGYASNGQGCKLESGAVCIITANDQCMKITNNNSVAMFVSAQDAYPQDWTSFISNASAPWLRKESCPPAAPTGCALALPVSWTTTNAAGNSKTCTYNGSGPEMIPEGQQRTFTGGSPTQHGAYPTNGTITYQCSGGVASVVSESCFADCTVKCSGPPLFGWTSSNGQLRCTCSGPSLVTIPNGGTTRLDANENGYDDVTCADGVPTYSPVCRGSQPD